MKRTQQSGFSMMEMIVALFVFLAVSSIVMYGMVQMVQTQGTVSNRTEMHTSVRGATELLQQEIGQAGRISRRIAVMPFTMSGPVVANTVAQTVGVTSTVNMFPNMLLDVDAGQNFEVVTVTATTPGSATATFRQP